MGRNIMAGAMQGMLHIDGDNIVSCKSMLVVLCLAIGTMAGELIGIEKGFERFGEWLKKVCTSPRFMVFLSRRSGAFIIFDNEMACRFVMVHL